MKRLYPQSIPNHPKSHEQKPRRHFPRPLQRLMQALTSTCSAVGYGGGGRCELAVLKASRARLHPAPQTRLFAALAGEPPVAHAARLGLPAQLPAEAVPPALVRAPALAAEELEIRDNKPSVPRNSAVDLSGGISAHLDGGR